MLSSGIKCYHLELILSLSSGAHIIIWDEMLSSGANVIIWSLCYHLGRCAVYFPQKFNVIMWNYHVMLLGGRITSPFLVILKTLLTPTFLNFIRSNLQVKYCSISI